MWEPVDLSNVCLPNSNLTACSYFGYAFLNLIVNLYGKPQFENIDNKHFCNETYDFIIVGAGSSGSVLAKRLSENSKWRVLLLEAGGEEPTVTNIPSLSSALLGSSSDWQFTTEPNGKSCLANNGRCPWPSYRQRPYHVEYTGSRPITEVKQRRAWSVLGWVTAWEHHVMLAFCLNPKDIYGYPLINPNYFGEEVDLLALLRGVDFILSLRHTKAFKESGAYFIEIPLPPCDKFKWGTKDYFICLMKTFTASTYHPVGTCKMGPECDSEAVVDSKLKVYGIDRLRVIDGSIMPRAPSGNTNAACLLIGELGAEFIINYWTQMST